MRRVKARPKKIIGGLGARMANPYLNKVMINTGRSMLWRSMYKSSKRKKSARVFPAGYKKKIRSYARRNMSWKTRGVRPLAIANLPSAPALPTYKMIWDDVIEQGPAAAVSAILLNKIDCIELDAPTGAEMTDDNAEAAAVAKRMDDPKKRTSNRVLLRTVGVKCRIAHDACPNNGYIECAILCAKTTIAGTTITATTEIMQGPDSNNQSVAIAKTEHGWVQSLLKFNSAKYNVLARKRFPLSGPTKSNDEAISTASKRLEYDHTHFTFRWNLPIFKTLQFESDTENTPTNMPIYFVWWWDTYDRAVGADLPATKSPTVYIRKVCTFKDGVARQNM